MQAHLDPFGWLEDDTPEVLAWQDEQRRRADRAIRGWPGYPAVLEALRQSDDDGSATVPAQHGSWWFRHHTPDGGTVARPERAPTPRGPWAPVWDQPPTDAPSETAAFPDAAGRFVLLLTTTAGRAAGTARVVDLRTGDVVLAGLPHDQVFGVAWLPADGGLLYSAPDPARGMRSSVHLLRLDGTVSQMLDADDLDHPVAIPRISHDGHWAWVDVDHTQPRPQWLARLVGGAPQRWTPFVGDGEHLYRGVMVDGDFVCVTTQGAPRGRVVAIPPGRADQPATWRELVPPSDAVVAGLAAAGHRTVAVVSLDKVAARLVAVTLEGETVATAPLPGPGKVSRRAGGGVALGADDLVVPCEGGVTFLYQSFDVPPTPYRWTVGATSLEPLAPTHAMTSMTTERIVSQRSATSTGAVEVPYTVIAPAGVAHPAPALVTGYGGFNIAHLPSYHPSVPLWLEAGGIVVSAYPRGGGELGVDWWRAGRMASKQRTFDDMVAVLEDLVRQGLTTPAQVALVGGSLGGLMVGAVLTQHPDLLGAAVARMATFDLLGVERDPAALSATVMELGDPRQREQRRWLEGYSPYQAVTEATAYPAVLLDCGANDPVCPAWHSRKMAARLQAATSSDRPVLLNVWPDSGHGTPSRNDQLLQLADWLSFAMATVGLSPAGYPSDRASLV